jgi:CBS domain-containing protein
LFAGSTTRKKEKKEDSMNVSEIMSTPIEEVMDKDPIIRAAGKMKDLDVGALPVKSEGNRLVGIITDRDIVVRSIAHGLNPEITPVGDIMTRGIFSCSADQTPEEAAKIMADAKVRRLVVVNPDNSVVGILSLGDVAVKGAGRETAGEAVEKISRPDPRNQ